MKRRKEIFETRKAKSLSLISQKPTINSTSAEQPAPHMTNNKLPNPHSAEMPPFEHLNEQLLQSVERTVNLSREITNVTDSINKTASAIRSSQLQEL